jgi:hypothetical protein
LALYHENEAYPTPADPLELSDESVEFEDRAVDCKEEQDYLRERAFAFPRGSKAPLEDASHIPDTHSAGDEFVNRRTLPPFNVGYDMLRMMGASQEEKPEQEEENNDGNRHVAGQRAQLCRVRSRD